MSEPAWTILVLMFLGLAILAGCSATPEYVEAERSQNDAKSHLRCIGLCELIFTDRTVDVRAESQLGRVIIDTENEEKGGE